MLYPEPPLRVQMVKQLVKATASSLELISLFSLPNTTLAITYLKAIKKININIKLHLIKRIKVGYNSNETTIIDDYKLELLYQFAEQNHITFLSITGGEPFIYWDNVKKILDKFNDPKYKITFNSNFSLVHNYYEELMNYNSIEFHVNLSSICNETHEKVINRTYCFLIISPHRSLFSMLLRSACCI